VEILALDTRLGPLDVLVRPGGPPPYAQLSRPKDEVVVEEWRQSSGCESAWISGIDRRVLAMHRMTRFLPLLAVVSLALPASASAARRWTFDHKASVRNHDSDFIIGYAYANGEGPNTPTTDHIDVQTTRGPWKYGYVDGPFRGWGGLPACGWVLGGSGRLHPTTGSENVPNRCPSPSPRDSNANPPAPQNIFAAGSYAYGTGGATVLPAVIQACPTGAFVYGNYNPATKTFATSTGRCRSAAARPAARA
jgi:hypothetical protein